jgi:hypothetical protein
MKAIRNDRRGRAFGTTPGRSYFIIGFECDYIRILNDFGEPILYHPKFFEIPYEPFPEDWIWKFADGDMYGDPRGLGGK